MRKILGLVLAFIILCVPLRLQAAPVEPEHLSSLKLEYGYEDLDVKVYRVAEVFPDGTYELTGAFSDYPVNIYGITAQGEWNEVRETLSSYIAADEIEPTCSGKTDEKGKVLFAELLPGMYLIGDIEIDLGNEIGYFENFLVTVPTQNEDGTHNYDVVAKPKCLISEPVPEPVEHKVVKQWKDYGKENERPELIEVEIYKDGNLDATVQLSESNNWTYRWNAVKDGSRWSAVEKNVPDGYRVTTVTEGNTILVTNTCEGEESYPKTGDQISMWPYVLGLCFSGMVLIIIGVWRKRKA